MIEHRDDVSAAAANIDRDIAHGPDGMLRMAQIHSVAHLKQSHQNGEI